MKANLQIAFPEKTDQERNKIGRKFYSNLASILFESLKGLSMTESELRERYIYKNADIFEKYFRENKSAIILGGHFCNWEWGVLSFPLWVQSIVLGIYKPIKNSRVESYLIQRRKRWGLELSPMSQAGRALIRGKTQSLLYVLIADQGPSNLNTAHWLPFFSRETPFLNGPDKIARQTGFPVFYYDIQRTGPCRYEVQFRQLCTDARLHPEGKVTEIFKEELEHCIRRNPADWLWSHRRWKRAR